MPTSNQAGKLASNATKSIKSNISRSSTDASRSKNNVNTPSSRPIGNVPKKDISGQNSISNKFPPPQVSSNSNNNASSPQSVAVVAGRKYIMVPKNVVKTGNSNSVNGMTNDAEKS